MRDYYEILSVSRTATAVEIKKAYRSLAMANHPDRNPGDREAEARFKEAAEAYEVLSNDEKRARYDRFGHAGVRGANGGGQQGFTDFSDIFDRFRDIFEGGGVQGGFGDIFGGGRTRRGPQQGRPGSDLRIKLPLTLEEIAEGVEKNVKVRKFVACSVCEGTGAEGGEDAKGASYDTCETCNGVGEVQRVTRSVFGQFVSVQPCPTCAGEGRILKDPCKNCKGEGRERGEETITIQVPPGVLEGNFLTMRGAGNAGVREGVPGDLRIEIEEIAHEHFVREGLDVFYDLVLSLPDAALGTEVDIPTLKGASRLTIDAGTQSGKILRMRGRGLPELGSSRRGDQLVRVRVWTPQRLSADETALLERLRESPAFKPGAPTNGNGHGKSFFSKVKDVFG